MNHESVIHFQIEASTLENLRAFADEIRPDLGCRAVPRRIDGKFIIDAYLPESQLQAAQERRADSGVALRIIENATEVGRERQKEVGQGNRFTLRGQVPQGLGRKE